MSSSGTENDNDTITAAFGSRQFWLAVLVFGFAFWLLWYVSSAALVCKTCTGNEHVQSVFTTITTLVGTWVGTLLAFYFARENFEAASRSMQRTIDKLSPDEQLHAVPITDAMIPRSEITVLQLAADQDPATLPLADFVARFAEDEKVTRLPILNADGTAYGILHEGELNKYLQNNQTLSAPTLGNMLDDAVSGRKLKLFGIVAANRSLRDAKTAMESQKDCRDVFVTQTGAAGEKVLGWITNVGILAAIDV